MKKTIAIIILIIICLGLGGYIAYDKLYAEKQVEKEPTEEQKIEKDEKKEELAPWLDYLLNTDGVKIKKIMGFLPYGKDNAGTNLDALEAELTIDELKDIYASGKVVKFINPCGRGGDGNIITITYEKDGKEYETSSYSATKFDGALTTDSDLVTAIEKSVTETKDMNGESSGCSLANPNPVYQMDFDNDKLNSYLTD